MSLYFYYGGGGGAGGGGEQVHGHSVIDSQLLKNRLAKNISIGISPIFSLLSHY